MNLGCCHGSQHLCFLVQPDLPLLQSSRICHLHWHTATFTEPPFSLPASPCVCLCAFCAASLCFQEFTRRDKQSFFINWKAEIILGHCVRMSHCLISLMLSLDAVTYIPTRITSDSFQKPGGLIHFGDIFNSFRSLMLHILRLFTMTMMMKCSCIFVFHLIKMKLDVANIV